MKWLLQNARQRATFAMKNPRYARVFKPAIGIVDAYSMGRPSRRTSVTLNDFVKQIS